MRSIGAASASVEVAVDPLTAFEIFTEEIELWWRPGPIDWIDPTRAVRIRFEFDVDGRRLIVCDAATGAVVETGRIMVWENGARLAFSYRGSGHDHDDTAVEVRFEPTDDGTRVTLEQQRWEHVSPDLSGQATQSDASPMSHSLASTLRMNARRGGLMVFGELREWSAYLDARLSRRRLLRYGMLTGVAFGVTGLLGACGGDDDDDDDPSTSSGQAETPAPAATGTATQASSGAAGSPTGTAAATTPAGDEGTPQVGGTLILAVSSVDTLDIHRSSDGNAMAIAWLMGSTPLAKDQDGEYHPWLSPSWEMAEDGLTWEFALRDDVAFHDGTPLTANDFAWTITRLLDPATAAPQAGRLRAVSTAEAVDERTLRLTLSTPYPIMLEQMSNTGVVQPYSQAFVEAQGDQFGQTFMGVGPYKFREWQTGEKVVIERNPDFKWAPAFVANQGPYYIETMEFRIVPEPGTIVAALEAGDAHYSIVTGDDVERLEGTGEIDVYEALTQGMNPALHMNMSQAPFDDLRVRKAFNLAVDRQGLVQIVVSGHGEPQFGPLSPTIRDYWSGVEEIGYGFDLEQATALMAEAGYTPGDDGILEKDGQPLQLTLKTYTSETKLAEVLQEQYKALGVDLKIEVVEPAVLSDQVLGGDYEIVVFGYLASESDILYRWFHTGRQGALNPSRASDPELDRLLDLTRSTLDLEERAQKVSDVQKYLVEQAFVVPLYMPKEFLALSKQVKGEIFSPPSLSATLKVILNDAYLEAA